MALIPISEITEGVPESYVQVPGVDGVGSVKLKAVAPYVLETLPKLLKVGVALLIVTEPATYEIV